ncbi:MAG TPA: phage holin family protein [Pseudomonadales bacterium]|nr:phage holin family protein [Pseudomonadales bacterium]
MADTAWGMLLCVIGVLVGLLGVAFFLFGAYDSLILTLPPWQAGGLVAVAALLLGWLILAVGRRQMAGRRAAPSSRDADEAAIAAEIRRAVEQGIGAGERLSGSGPSAVDLALAAFVAGLVASRGIGGRKPPSEGSD